MIKVIRCCLLTALQEIKTWTENWRMAMLLLLMFVTVAEFCNNINDFSSRINEATNAFAVLPHLYNNQYFRLVINFGIILMFSNAPFRNSNSLFCLIRTGYKKWCVGQLIYIVIASFIYTTLFFLLTIVCTVPTLGFSLSWGKTFSTLAQTEGLPLNIQYKIHLLYKPVDALLNTCLLLLMLSIFMGFLMFLLSTIFGRGAGTIVATSIVLVGLVPAFSSNPAIVARFSPCSLTQIALLDNSGISGYPTVSYAYIFFGISLILMATLTITIYSNRKIKHRIYAMEV